MRTGAAYRHDAMLSTAFCKCPGPDGILVEGETRVNGYKGWLMSAQSDAMRQAAFRTVQGGSIDGSACNSNHLVLYCMVWSGCREHELARIEDADRKGCEMGDGKKRDGKTVTGLVAVPETDRWTGTLSNDEAKRWRVAEAAQWLRLLSRWPLAFAFLFACGPPDASASNTKASFCLSPIAELNYVYLGNANKD
ncbi:hypothetical protein Trihar35433_3273 [Trichoderma harzianum]|nr:hypothetical protein Trihar35433_3273 [Trichoderma harzianum]